MKPQLSPIQPLCASRVCVVFNFLPVSEWRDEVEAAVDAIVHDVSAVQAALIV